MNEPLMTYFAGEKQAGVLCVFLGVTALAFSIWAWRAHPAFRAMAIPLGILGVVELGIGAVLVARTDNQVANLQSELSREPDAARARELARMDKINVNFRRVKFVEALLIIASLVMVFAPHHHPGVVAAGLGLLLQAAVLLAFDVFAESRAHIYTNWLR